MAGKIMKKCSMRQGGKAKRRKPLHGGKVPDDVSKRGGESSRRCGGYISLGEGKLARGPRFCAKKNAKKLEQFLRRKKSQDHTRDDLVRSKTLCCTLVFAVRGSIREKGCSTGGKTQKLVGLSGR